MIITMGILLLRPSFKTSVNVFLLKRGEQTSSAAAIAGLIGGRDAREVQKIAAAKVRVACLVVRLFGLSGESVVRFILSDGSA